ncbi:MAG: AAA family ATPase [Magnetococcales bacterium]|nr:AAA family ATPase [Magnetococcales bacterium]
MLRAEGLILITGPEGSGKSALVKRLPGMIPDNRDLAVIQSASLKDAEFLRQLIAATTLARDESGALVPVEDEALVPEMWEEGGVALPAMSMQDLLESLEERVAMGRKLVLVVEDAHALTPSAMTWLDLLVRYVSEEIRPVQLVLVGRSELRGLLDSEVDINLSSQLVGSCEVTPLTRREVWDFLRFQFDRLLESPVKLSIFAWMEIYGHSQGIPLKIELLLKRLLPLIRQRNAKAVDRAMVRLAMTMGRPMQPGSFVGWTPRQRLAVVAGGVVMLMAGVGQVAGWFGSAPSEGETVVVKKGPSGENTSYVKIIEPESPTAGKSDKPGDKSVKSDKADGKAGKADKPTEKGDKSATPKEGKPADEKGDDKATITKKRYWEPNMPVRPETPPSPQTLERMEAMVEAIEKLTAEPQPPRPSPPTDPEAFRKRYQTAKVISSTASAEPVAEGVPSTVAESAEKLLPHDLKKGGVVAPPDPKKGGAVAPPTPVPLRNARTGQVYDPFLTRSAPAPAPTTPAPALESGAEEGGVPILKARDLGRKPPPPVLPPPAQVVKVASAPPPEKSDSSGSAERFEERPEESKPKSVVAKPLPVKPKQADQPLPKISGVATEKSFRSVGRVYVVQIGSFAKVDGADQLKRTLSDHGRGDPYVHLYERKGKKLYSVRVNFRSRETAERMARTIQDQDGLSTKVMELNYD